MYWELGNPSRKQRQQQGGISAVRSHSFGRRSWEPLLRCRQESPSLYNVPPTINSWKNSSQPTHNSHAVHFLSLLSKACRHLGFLSHCPCVVAVPRQRQHATRGRASLRKRCFPSANLQVFWKSRRWTWGWWPSKDSTATTTWP